LTALGPVGGSSPSARSRRRAAAGAAADRHGSRHSPADTLDRSSRERRRAEL